MYSTKGLLLWLRTTRCWRRYSTFTRDACHFQRLASTVTPVLSYYDRRCESLRTALHRKQAKMARATGLEVVQKEMLLGAMIFIVPSLNAFTVNLLSYPNKKMTCKHVSSSCQRTLRYHEYGHLTALIQVCLSIYLWIL